MICQRFVYEPAAVALSRIFPASEVQSTTGPVGRTSAVISSQRGGGPNGVMWGNNMVSIVSTVAYLGLEARSVEVQCQVAPGVVSFAVVGLPD